MELIDKSALIAELEKRIEETKGMQPKFDQFWAGQISAFKGVLKILDTLEVKEVEEPTFDDFIQEGDKITVNEDGSRFNHSQLERVVELSRYSKPYEAKRVKRTSADIEAAMKEIDELSKAFTETHPEGADQMLREIRGEEPVSEELDDLEKAALLYYNDVVWSKQLGKKDEMVHFMAGAKWQLNKIMNDAVEREVKVDAGGYPYIDATELYDYENDKPLAKAGDKIKVLIVKE